MENSFVFFGIIWGSAAIFFILGLVPPFGYFIPIETRDKIYASPAYIITMWVLYAILVVPVIFSRVIEGPSDFGGLGEIILILLGIGLVARTITHR